MIATSFDTLAYSKTLQQAGFPLEQAEAMTKAQAEALKELAASRELTTKSDLLALKHEILKWMIGLAAAQMALGIALFALK